MKGIAEDNIDGHPDDVPGCGHNLKDYVPSEASKRIDSVGFLQQALSGMTSVYWCDCLAEQQSMRGGTTIQPISISVPLAIINSVNVCIRRGYSTAGDGGGGVFVWTHDTTIPQSTDPMGALLVVPNGPRTGCWKRLYTGPMNVKWFGAKGDGHTNDTGSIQAALNTTDSKGGAIYLPKGTYSTNETLNVKSGSVISGDGWASIILFAPQNETPCMLVNTSNGYKLTLIKDLSIQTNSSKPTVGIQVDGASTTIRNIYIEGSINGSNPGFNTAGILISESIMVRIEDCSIADCYGDGIKLGGNSPSYGIYIGPHNSVHENRGSGINCSVFAPHQSSEVHIFENDVESNNYNFPKARYQITGCIGPGSIRSNHLESIDVSPYLFTFTWEEIPGNDSEKLKEALWQIYGVNLTNVTKIEKSFNGSIINISTEEKSLSLKLNDAKTEAILEVNNVRIGKFIAELENGETRIYKSPGAGRALIYLGPYCRAVTVENNNFVGPDDYGLIADFSRDWSGLSIRANSFSAGGIANIWLQQVPGCTIENNAHFGAGPVRIDYAPGLRMFI